MSEVSASHSKLPPEQEAIRAKCFHPSGTFVEFPVEDVETSIPARFEKIVSLYPDRLAIKMGEEIVTYDELNQAANRIAQAILNICGKDSKPVALLLDLGIDLVAAIFGSLKAGKCHTALDPSFPQERIAHIFDDSQASLIITNKCLADLARKLTNNRRSLLNISEVDRALPADNLALSILPTDLAKIRYTSGSTGKPQGVVRTHRDMLWRAMSITNEEMHTCAEDRLTLLHYPSFASADNHLFSSLLNGAALYPFDVKSEGISRMAKWLADEQITVYHSPPAVFRQLAETISLGERIPSLRLIYLSGAPITRQDFERYKAKFADGTLLQVGMGSTEARRVSGAFVDKTFCFPDQGSPVGYPRSDLKVLVLDDSGQEVTAGEVGEIAIKGPYVDPGYWNQQRSEMSADSDSSDMRLYLTGDLGRMLPDGFLIHLGRKDLMVKIRGYRVNLGEVEAALLEHPQVNEAGVAAWERDPGEKYLVGYIVAREESALNVSDLNKFLRNKLPDYMVPSTFMFLQSLPLTNGKLNRSALPKPGNRRPDIKVPYISPSSDVEQRLSFIWADILSIDQIGIHDNFFDLGGHSLAATRVVSQVTKKFQLDLPLQSLFQSPTIAGMAAVIAKHQGKQLGEEELERILGELESLSDEEAQRLLTGNAASKSRRDRNE